MTKQEETKNNKTQDTKPEENRAKPAAAPKSVYAQKKQERGGPKKRRSFSRRGQDNEFEQRIVDIARVTRVMAGGKRMRFRACVAIGDKKGKVGIGVAKGADVPMGVTKAVNIAKKNMIDVSIVNETIPHEIYYKLGAAKILLKPARKGKGVIAGGAVRIVLELAGVNNITTKNLGTNNKVNVSKCVIEALKNLKKVENKKDKNKKNNKSVTLPEKSEVKEVKKQDK
ncbi:30S ribosomal protein S5 [bacterium]|nr:30S ribosomal protein S5 [bacterium]